MPRILFAEKKMKRLWVAPISKHRCSMIMKEVRRASTPTQVTRVYEKLTLPTRLYVMRQLRHAGHRYPSPATSLGTYRHVFGERFMPFHNFKTPLPSKEGVKK